MSIPIYEIKWDYFDDFEEALRFGFDAKYLWYQIFLRPSGLGFFKNPELVYIGTSTQTISDRLLGKHEALKAIYREMDNDVSIAQGFWTGGGRFRNQKTISSNVIKEIEAALIAEFKPRLNGVGVKGYQGKTIGIISFCSEHTYLDSLNHEISFE